MKQIWTCQAVVVRLPLRNHIYTGEAQRVTHSTGRLLCAASREVASLSCTCQKRFFVIVA